MIKITANSIMVCAILFCVSTIAMAGSPYNFTGSAPGTQISSHVATPALTTRPAINGSAGYVTEKEKALKKKARAAPQSRHPASHAAPLPPVSGARANAGLRHLPSPGVQLLPGKAKSVNGGGGFAPKTPRGVAGLNKPVTGPGGKPLLSPGVTSGPRHVLHGGHAPHIGFAGRPAAGLPVIHPPVTGPGGAPLGLENAPQMKLTLQSLYRSTNRHNLPIGIVGRGDRVVAVFDITNLGTATGRVRVGKVGRPLFITDEVAIVAPGHTANLQLEVPVTAGNHVEGTWKPVFRFMTTTNQEYRDSNMADNYVTGALSFDSWSGDIAVEKIFGGTVTMNSWTGGYHRIPWLRQAWVGSGSSIPETYTLKVRVGNHDAEISSPRQLTVMLKGLAEYNPVSSDRHYPESNSKMMNCSSTPGCHLSVTLTVPALDVGERKDIPVTFNNLSYRLWVDDRENHGYHRIRAGGYYRCSETRVPSIASIQVTVGLDTHGDASPSNNGLRQSFSIGTWSGSSCQVSRTADAQAFIP